MPDENNTGEVNNQVPPVATVDNGQGPNTPEQGHDQSRDGGDQGEMPLTWDKWLADQPEAVKTLVDGHVDGLRSALDNEREERKKLSRQLSQVRAGAEKGSELEKQLSQLEADLNSAQLRADFAEQAAGRVTNIKLARLSAEADGLIEANTSKSGGVNWDRLFQELETAYPELFKKDVKPQVKSNAGSGTQTPPGGPVSMNDLIRQKARGG